MIAQCSTTIASSRNTLTSTPNISQPTKTFTLKATTHTLDTLPPNSILVHSTNCFGEWGAGVALAIYNLFPGADKVYTNHCDSLRPSPDAWPDREKLVGTCLLIPPQPGDKREGVWIACLFTSYGYGRHTKKKAGKDGKGKIVKQTERALADLKRQAKELAEGRGAHEEAKEEEKSELLDGGRGEDSSVQTSGKRKRAQEGSDADKSAQKTEKVELVPSQVMDIYSPQLNSGSFKIPFEETKAMVEDILQDWEGKWFVISPPK